MRTGHSGFPQRRRASPSPWLSVHPQRILGRLPSPAFEQLLGGILALCLVIAMGVAGYVAIAGFPVFDALYQTVLTITTIGFAEVRPLDTAGRTFTIVLALVGVGTGLYIFTAVGRIIIEGELVSGVEAWRMQRQIATLQDHVILCGAGRVGAEVARRLSERSEPFVVIDPQPEAAERARSAGWPTIQGNASEDDVLAQAQIARAQTLIAASGHDAENTFIILSAKALNQNLYVLARANAPGSDPKLRQAGADRVIAPTLLAGRRMASLSLHPAIVDFAETFLHGVETGDVLAQVDVQAGSAWEGKAVREVLADLPNVVVLGIRHASGQIHVGTDASDTLRAGDAIMVLGPTQAIELLSEAAASR